LVLFHLKRKLIKCDQDPAQLLPSTLYLLPSTVHPVNP
jgi:hypothetical protein